MNAIQSVTVTASEGSYRLVFDGENTADILLETSAIEFKDALEGTRNIATNDVIVTVPSAGVYIVEFVNNLGNQPVPLMTVAAGDSNLVGTVSVVEIRGGA